MSWRVARSLDVLLRQINTAYPRRSKASDGSIGDAAHASRASDHNPWYGPGIVTARDFTHDPSDGLNCHNLASWLVNSGDRRIKYIIWDHKIWQGGWSNYSGPNSHTKHLHLSVVASPLCDNTAPWDVGDEEESFMAGLSEAQQKYILDTVKEMDTRLTNVEAYLKPPSTWKVHAGWVPRALSVMQTNVGKILAAVLPAKSVVDTRTLAEVLRADEYDEDTGEEQGS